MSAQNSLPPDAKLVALAAESLCSADTAARIGEVSLTNWYDRVRYGHAPKPVIRKHRFTRWRVTDILDYWRREAEEGIRESAAQAEPATVSRARRIRAMRSFTGPKAGSQ